jgi:hypothetical protein
VAGAPEQKWYDMQMQASIEMADNGGEMPLWAKIAYGDIPGQGIIPKWAPGNAQANDQWFLPSYLQAHPEALKDVERVVLLARGLGQDPKEAVAKWWEGQQGLLLNMASRGINDPLNLAAGAGAIARTLEGAALGSEVLGDASKANRLRVASHGTRRSRQGGQRSVGTDRQHH